jgi:hypothetical protein
MSNTAAPLPPVPSQIVRFWAPSALVDRLDRLIGARALNRSEAARQAMLAGLDVLEQRVAPRNPCAS